VTLPTTTLLRIRTLPLSIFELQSTDALISFLPLSHVTARALDYVMFSYGVQCGLLLGSSTSCPRPGARYGPRFLVGLPRVFEKNSPEVEAPAAGLFRRSEADARMGLRWRPASRHCL